MNESKPTLTQSSQEISLKNRTKMSISGVKEVISFDEAAVNLRTVCGELAVEGAGLHIGTLDSERGVVLLEGSSIDGIWYVRDGNGERKGIFGRWRK